MSAPIILPFNNQPVSTQKGTGTYTCPAGKYALVRVVLRARATTLVSAITSPDGGQPPTSETNSVGESLEIWVGPGDTVSGSLSNASGTTAVGSNARGTRTSTTTAQVNHNGTAIGIIEASSCAMAGTSAGGSATIASSGSSSFHFYAQEYNILS